MQNPLLPSRTGWPTEDVYVYLHHPANDRPFLRLHRSDASPSPSSSDSTPVYGIHHQTLLTAASILACNEPGYLSTSLDPSSRVDAPPDAVLLGRVYYFYLLPPHQDPSYLYPLTRNFKDWRFPHGALPQSWSHERPMEEDNRERIGEDNINRFIEDRDKVCVISGWKDGRSVAQLVPGDHHRWLQNNEMRVYLSDPIPMYHLDPRNLFTLRGDLHLLFNQGYLAFLPKNSTGNFRVHFLRKTQNAGMAFHDVDANDAVAVLSTELMYARFALALMSIMNELVEVDHFRFVGEQQPGHGKRGQKRKGGNKKPETPKHKAPRLDRDRGEHERVGR